MRNRSRLVKINSSCLSNLRKTIFNLHRGLFVKINLHVNAAKPFSPCIDFYKRLRPRSRKRRLKIHRNAHETHPRAMKLHSTQPPRHVIILPVSLYEPMLQLSPSKNYYRAARSHFDIRKQGLRNNRFNSAKLGKLLWKSLLRVSEQLLGVCRRRCAPTPVPGRFR